MKRFFRQLKLRFLASCIQLIDEEVAASRNTLDDEAWDLIKRKAKLRYLG